MFRIGIVLGYSGSARPSPKNLIAGISTSHENTPPAKIVPAIFGPMM